MKQRFVYWLKRKIQTASLEIMDLNDWIFDRFEKRWLHCNVDYFTDWLFDFGYDGSWQEQWDALNLSFGDNLTYYNSYQQALILVNEVADFDWNPEPIGN